MPTKPGGIHQGAKTLSIMPTYTCTAACSDCSSVSSPGAKERLPREVMMKAIEQAKALGFCNVVFTGGEATLRWRDLLACISYATSLGLPTRVVTNAHWAVTLERAGQRLDVLMEHGLSAIDYSTGDEHARFVPWQRIVLAIAAALDRDLPVHVMVELRRDRRITRAMLLEHPLVLARAARAKELLEITESAWMPLDHDRIERYPPGVATNAENLPLQTGCGSVLQTYTLQADGRIGACCGLGMRLIPELSVGVAEGEKFLQRAIEDAEEDFMKVWLRYAGPKKILAWAAGKDPTIKWEDMYAHPCQACHRVYEDPRVGAVIRKHHEEVVAEVLQSAWLEERHIPDAMDDAYVPEREGA